MIQIEKNVLSGELSPYLIQHKDNPVNWQIWSKELLDFSKFRLNIIFFGHFNTNLTVGIIFYLNSVNKQRGSKCLVGQPTKYFKDKLYDKNLVKELSQADYILVSIPPQKKRDIVLKSFDKLLKNHNIDFKIVQENTCISNKNVVRGFHYQKEPYSQSKLLQVLIYLIYNIYLLRH